MQKITKQLVFIFSIVMLSNTNISAQNFITNGDFESGGNGVGFNINGTGYTEITAPFSGTTVSGNYAFTTNPQPMNTAFFIAGGDHTTGTGNMMVIDGNTTGGQQRFWRAGNTGGGVCGLTVGVTYTFSFWIKSVATTVTSNATRANLGLQFNNASNITLVSGVLLAPLPASGWQQVIYTLKATNTCVNIEIWNNNTSAVGNDFAVDDFSLVPTVFPLSLTHSITYPSCPGAADAALVAYGRGGVPPYVSYSISGPVTATNTTGVFTGLAAGTYSLSITDTDGTSFTQNGIVVDAVNDLIVSPDSNLCSGTAFTLSATNSPGPFSWTAVPADPTLTAPNSPNPTVTPLVTTTYTVTSNPTVAPNLVYNGNFTSGDVGFHSDYEYLAFTTPIGEQQTYGVAANSQSWFPGFSPCLDHTTPGTGKMMVVDGSNVNAGNDKVWCQTMAVNPGQNYTFSYWVQTIALSNLANLEVLINGVSVGLSLAPATTCNWVQKTYVWNSGVSTTAQICIYDRTTTAAGNDFAIDDISFVGNTVTCNLSKSVTITVLNGVNLIITNPAAVCSPSTVNLTLPAVTAGSTSGTVLTYWTNAAATTPLVNPTAVSVSGTYYIKSTLSTCSDIQPVTVTINSLAAPVVTTPVSYCQNSTAASPLVATPLAGNTLNWYGTNATGGTASSVAPTPSTATIGSTTYYVSQTNGVCESPRAAIVVTVTAAGGPTLNLYCADVNPTYINFDFSNVGQTSFNITYSIDGGPPVSVIWFSPSNYDVTGLLPGQTVVFTISANGVTLCTPVETVTCNSTCTTSITPNFAPIAPFCSGSTAPVLGTTSPNGISGTWSPATVSNTTSGSYVFTPNSILHPCATTQTLAVTVTPIPTAGTLSGNQNICVGLTTTFSSTTTGGSWSSSDTAIATVNSGTGVVTGVAAGTATITYFIAAAGGCSSVSDTRTVTVTAAPIAGTLSGNQNICVGLNSTFSSTISGGSWSSSNPAVATINTSTGDITGISAGTSTMSYTVTGAGGCPDAVATRIITIVAPPNAGTLSGNQNICVGLTTTFLSTSTGGSWSSSDTTIATVNPGTGIVTGIAAGTATITYTVIGTAGCANATATRTVTVTAAPNPGVLSGIQNICVGLTSTFSSSGTGGTWSSSNIAIATVDLTTGVITGVTAGTATILYTVIGTGGCANVSSTRTVTVTAAPNAGTLSGNQNICAGLTSTFSSSATGGSWSSSDTTIATVNSGTGVVTGVSAGTATITYTVTGTGGCPDAIATRTVTVTAAPNAGTLSGNQSICAGLTSTFSSTSSGGNWSSSDTAVAIVNTSTGVVTGIAAGTATISYTVTGTGGCANAVATRAITVVASPSGGTISGNLNICVGTTSTFSSTSTGGSWSSSDTTIATVNPATGLVTGVAAGTAIITYTVIGTGGCATLVGTANASVTVLDNTIPDFLPIAPFCTGSTAPVLATTSPNGITGTWFPPTISNTANGNYVFTPNPGQCASSQTLNVVVLTKAIPDFPQIPDFCAGSPVPVLATTSPNGINGTWSPAVVSNTLSGAYVFIPDASECSTGQILIVNVLQPIAPDFEDMDFCSGSAVPNLSNTSPNGISGTWSPAVIDNLQSGIYTFTPNADQCAFVQTINITINLPTLVSVDYKVSEAFQENQVITVIAMAAGNYLYQLDNSNFQSSNVFENVSPGTHTITVMDANGCSQPITITDVIIIDYPKFFTPNGDDINDTWNIFSLAGYSGAKISIFDRYGKLLKQISPNGAGWNGTYNGQNMPSSDYWFSVEFYENNVLKVFNAHFSLKR